MGFNYTDANSQKGPKRVFDIISLGSFEGLDASDVGWSDSEQNKTKNNRENVKISNRSQAWA